MRYHTGRVVVRPSTGTVAVHSPAASTTRYGASPVSVDAVTQVTQAVGAYGERLAVRHLREAGLVLLARTWRPLPGEIDIIARVGDVLVFCEVKTRRGSGFGSPAEAVDGRKVARLRRLAAEWLAQSRVRPREVRFDVVCVLTPHRGAPTVEHVRGAF